MFFKNTELFPIWRWWNRRTCDHLLLRDHENHNYWTTMDRRMLKMFVSHIWLFVTPWTVAHQAPLFLEFSRKEYWSGLLFPSPGDLPDLGIKPMSPAWQANSLPLSQQESLHMCKYVYLYMFMCMHLCVCILYVCLCMCLFAESNDYP